VKNEASSPESILETRQPLLPPTSRLAIKPTTDQPSSNNQLHPSPAPGIWNPSANRKTYVPAQQPPPRHHSLFPEPQECTATRNIHVGTAPPREFAEAGSHPWGILVQNPQPEGGEHVLQFGLRAFRNQGYSSRCVEGRGEGRFTRYFTKIGV